ncbi:MYND-type domain-containing protein [Favolaschia claudopus]|uniref:MYND-type domain-containing protein n=1 Tax=Favolaschia claudopus TaxID=2862362 RepID=A0AAW0EGE2_9AGAR
MSSPPPPQIPDLNNELNFPPYPNLPDERYLDKRYYSRAGPPKFHWCFLAEIKNQEPWIRPTYYKVKDRNDKEYLVSFHLGDPTRDQAVAEMCRDGYTICVMYAERHLFADGQIGVRVEDEDSVKVWLAVSVVGLTLPCTLKEFFDIRDKLANNDGVCNLCTNPATLKCARCKLLYCSQTCQAKDWKGVHKTECKTAQQILKWGMFDWDQFDEPRLFNDTSPRIQVIE